MLEAFEDKRREGGPGAAPRADLGDEADLAGSVRCAACGAVLTSADARIEVLGLFVHECENPHGYRFRFGCFAAVPGCREDSNPSSEWSWFPGFQWQIAICAACRTHVGWRFVRVDSSFFALILDRIILSPD